MRDMPFLDFRGAILSLKCDAVLILQAGVQVVLTCIHDEATLRMKSFAAAEGLPARPRGRYSKIQNTCAHVTVNDDESVPWLVHLRPLHHKDGPSLAASLAEVVLEVMTIMTEAASNASGIVMRDAMHLGLVAVGDGILTNKNAINRILGHFSEEKNVMSIKFPPAILRPEMAAPILWAPGIFWFFLLETPHAHKSPPSRGGGGLGFLRRGGGSADFIFMGVGIFPNFASSPCCRCSWVTHTNLNQQPRLAQAIPRRFAGRFSNVATLSVTQTLSHAS